MYEEVCKTISSSQYSTITIRDYLAHPTPEGHFILLRHDVDTSVAHAYRMAQLEHQYGLRSTFYFRTKNNVFVPSILEKIAALHHEIGYHYETLDTCKGDMEQAIQLFGRELAMFREHFDVKTVCMHGNPLTRYDNRKLWDHIRFQDYDLLGEPYLSLDYNTIAYYSDSGRTWSKTKNKVKDYTNGGMATVDIDHTYELIEVIQSGMYDTICILAHPLRWTNGWYEYLRRLVIEYAYIVGKRVLTARNTVLNIR